MRGLERLISSASAKNVGKTGSDEESLPRLGKGEMGRGVGVKWGIKIGASVGELFVRGSELKSFELGIHSPASVTNPYLKTSIKEKKNECNKCKNKILIKTKTNTAVETLALFAWSSSAITPTLLVSTHSSAGT